jgi:dTDP-4-dehydrorhamnose 3,5-epimerase-like enzyme
MPAYRLIQLPEHVDARGALTFGQEGDQIPFSVRRFFTVYDIVPGASRGNHAHRKQHQLLIMMSGAASVMVDDGQERVTVRLERPSQALHAPPMLWLELGDFTPGAACMVLASDIYRESDYVRDWQEFLRLTGEKPRP